MLNLQCVWSLCRLLAILSAFSNASLRKQTSFGDDTTGFLPCEQRPFDLPRQVDRTLGRSKGLCSQGTGFPAKWRLRNERRNSILTTCHYPDPGSDASSVWNFCARFSRPTSFHGETSCFLRLHQIRITPLYKDDMMYSLQCKASTGFSSVNIFVPLNICFLCYWYI